MERAVRPALRLRRPVMPWGLVTGLEVVVLALVSAGLVLHVFPAMFDVHWDCSGASGAMHTSADVYIGAFSVGGALGWIIAAAATAILHASGRRLIALVVPLAWFAGLVLLALAIVSAIGPLTC